MEWSARKRREFPWRDIQAIQHIPERHVPWMILVSEVLLQQTQARRVMKIFGSFMLRYPTPADLAGASPADVLVAWRGLGYNSRGLRLREAAQAIVAQHGGLVPASFDDLRSLPGVGPYTAKAVLCFAFGSHVVPVDVNITRVISRIFFGPVGLDHRASGNLVERASTWLLSDGDAKAWVESLMDLGATVCTARSPTCGACPLADVCLGATPLRHGFFGDRRRVAEPLVLGLPRRLWRGRVVEQIRQFPDGLSGFDLAQVLSDTFHHDMAEIRRVIAPLLQGLTGDGLLEHAGVVEDGDLGLDSCLYRLPRE